MFLLDYAYGLVPLPVWAYVLVTFVLIQLTIFCVTVYLHRDAAHRALDLNPVIRHLCRFWVWMTTGMTTRAWVAVHRKHHAHCETADDPHSPKYYGLKKVVLEGAELYRQETANPETLEKYTQGCPDDAIEHFYTRYSFLGITILVIAYLVLFGVVGIIMLSAHLVSIPLFAAGIINGVGHHTGYRNFECPDQATNIVPWGVILGGEELHNNHHAFPSSAKFSVRRWEFDAGWFAIRVLSAVGLAKVRRVAPTPLIKEPRKELDFEAVRAVWLNRMHVLRAYTRKVTLPVFKSEIEAADPSWKIRLRNARRSLTRRYALLDDARRERLNDLLEDSASLKTVHEFRERLVKLWEGRQVSNERLLQQFREWCTQAEASGIRSLEEFAHTLRGFSLATA